MFEVKIKNKASKVIAKMEKANFIKIKKFVENLKYDPVPSESYDIVKIADSDSAYRIRVGRHRVTYKVYWSEKIIRVIFVERRKESTYRNRKSLR